MTGIEMVHSLSFLNWHTHWMDRRMTNCMCHYLVQVNTSQSFFNSNTGFKSILSSTS